jgi:hypothetical protein
MKSPSIYVGRHSDGIELMHGGDEVSIVIPFQFVAPMALAFYENRKASFEWYNEPDLPYPEAHWLTVHPMEIEVLLSQAHGENEIRFIRRDFAALCQCAMAMLATVPPDEYMPEDFDVESVAE